MNIIIGVILYINFIDLLKLKENLKNKTLTQNIRSVFNFLFLNFSLGVFDVERIFLFSTNANLHLFKLILNYSVIALNTFPLMSNLFIKKNLFNIPICVYPSPIALATLTIFLNYFRNLQVNSKIVIIIDILCYSFLIINFINDVVFLKNFSYEQFFFVLLNILNLIFIYYYDIFNLHDGIKHGIGKLKIL